MARSAGLGEAAVWRRRVRRFARAGMTVDCFCEEEGVSASSFYRWRKKLAEGQTPPSGGRHMPAFQAVRVTAGDLAVAILLPGGARLEVPAANLDVVRAVMGELLRHDFKQNHFAELERGRSTC